MRKPLVIIALVMTGFSASLLLLNTPRPDQPSSLQADGTGGSPRVDLNPSIVEQTNPGIGGDKTGNIPAIGRTKISTQSTFVKRPPVLDQDVSSSIAAGRQSLTRFPDPIALQSEVPNAMRAFHASQSKDQVRQLAKMMENPNLSPEILEYFRASLHDPELNIHVKNNMLNALQAQEEKNPYLYLDLAQLADDPKQPERFRAYAVQALAMATTYSKDPEGIASYLNDLSLRDNGLVGQQARMMLSVLDLRGHVGMGDTIVAREIQVLENPSASPQSQMVALSLLGREKAMDHRPLLREFAARSGPAQRVAIAALGELAHQDDRELIEDALKSEDALVRLAAESALKKFH